MKKDKPSREDSPGVMLPAADLAAIAARAAAGFRAQAAIAGTGLEMIEKIKDGRIALEDDCPQAVAALKDNEAAVGMLNALGHLIAAVGMIAAKLGDDAVAFDSALRMALKAGDAVEADLPRTGRELFDLLPGTGSPGKAAEKLLEAIDHDRPAGAAGIALLMRPWKEISASADAAGSFEVSGSGKIKRRPAPDKPAAAEKPAQAPDKPSPPKWNGDRWRTGEDAGEDWNPDGTRN